MKIALILENSQPAQWGALSSILWLNCEKYINLIDGKSIALKLPFKSNQPLFLHSALLKRLNKKWFSKWVDSGHISFIIRCQDDYTHITFIEAFSSSNFYNTGFKKVEMWFFFEYRFSKKCAKLECNCRLYY